MLRRTGSAERLQHVGQIELPSRSGCACVSTTPSAELFDKRRTTCTMIIEPRYEVIVHDGGSSLTTRATHIWAVALTGAALFMITLDNLIVLSTLPSMQRDLGGLARPAAVGRRRLHPRLRRPHADAAPRSATATAAGACSSSGLLRVHRLLGRGRALARASRSSSLARAVQGLGAALLMPLTLTLLLGRLPARAPHAPRSASGRRSPGSAWRSARCSAACIVETLDWHWIFWINVPVGLTAAALAPRRLTESRGAPGAARPAGPRARERRPARRSSGRPRAATRTAGPRASHARRVRDRRRRCWARSSARSGAPPPRCCRSRLFRRPRLRRRQRGRVRLPLHDVRGVLPDHPVPHAGAWRLRRRGRRRDAAVDADAARRLALHGRARWPHRQPAADRGRRAPAARRGHARAPPSR